MKYLDRFLRNWRVAKAMEFVPNSMNSVFDIGCGDGYLLTKLALVTERQDAIDPRVSIQKVSKNSTLMEGFFPADVPSEFKGGQYDAIFALAVFEHLTELDLNEAANVIHDMLTPSGRLIVTVPHPIVDIILDVLRLFRLVEAETLEEHHGFVPAQLPVYLSSHLKLVTHKKFQFGLNNVYVCEKRGPGCN